MRTTLDLDDTVLAAARSLARSRRISLGDAVSELARRGLLAPVAEVGSTRFDGSLRTQLATLRQKLEAAPLSPKGSPRCGAGTSRPPRTAATGP